MSEKKAEVLKQLGPGQDSLCLMEAANQLWNARIPAGVGRKEILETGFWAHHAVKMRPGDEVRALCEDGSWRATYLVVDQSRTWVRVRELTFDTFDKEVADQSDVEAFINAHEVKHRGPRKWSVVRKVDNAVLSEDIAEREEAIAWLSKHAGEQARAKAA